MPYSQGAEVDVTSREPPGHVVQFWQRALTVSMLLMMPVPSRMVVWMSGEYWGSL